MTAPIRATFLTVMPAPYMQDLFAAMRDDGRIIPRVLYMEMAAPDTYWGRRTLPPNETVLDGRWFSILGGRVHWNRGVLAALRGSASDIHVISGYSSLTCQAAVQWLRATGRPWVFLGERPAMRSRRLAGRMLREIAAATGLRSAGGVAAVGSEATETYRQRCRARIPVQNIPYYTDIATFSENPAKPGSIPNRIRVLYCGQLIHRKGVDLLVRAISQLAVRCPHVTLDLVGEGPLRHELQESIPLEYRRRFTFHGFSNVEALPAYFSSADLFVLPSRHDGWGVVVNQALAAGLPIVASDAVGAARDFVADRGTGRIVPAGDVDRLAGAIEYFATHPDVLRSCGAAARTVAGELSLQTGVANWLSLFRDVLDRSSAPRNPA